MRGSRDTWLAVFAGGWSILMVNLAYLLNVQQGLEGCFPYLEGCHSVSRGIRSGPGLWLFKIGALPASLAMALLWIRVSNWLTETAPDRRNRARAVRWLGLLGAVFFVVYATWLGTEGEIYRWLRRYGVVFYFAGTGLAQLLLLSALPSRRSGVFDAGQERARTYFATGVGLTWLLGILSAFKRRIVDNPEFLDRMENALEWDFALCLSVVFLLVPALMRQQR